ncbi:MAG: pyridoxal-phosphate dependent enzyme, partial [Chloroflexota bacterium]
MSLPGLPASPTPLLPLNDPPGRSEIYLKLESLQPVGSFKLRGAQQALDACPPEALAQGVWTASAGNMGYALAWAARRRGVACTVIVPDDAPHNKLAAIQAQGAQVWPAPFSIYQEIQRQDSTVAFELPPGRLVHPFADPAVIAGNGGLAAEIVAQLPQVQAILAPYGGGGLCCGLAQALVELGSQAQVIACEVESGAPLTASLRAGRTA